MRTADFDYELPADRIAQSPAEPRDSSRLLVVCRDENRLEHRRFRDLPDYLSRGDLLVANDTRVIPARLRGRKSETGGAVEALLLSARSSTIWEAMLRGRVRPGTRLLFRSPRGVALGATVIDLLEGGGRLIEFDEPLTDVLQDLGEVPLPPYIHEALSDTERYQTVYARVAGSSAAPTAGLHFTPGLIERLKKRGVRFAFVTLHVGMGTFRPVASRLVEDHEMHREWCSLPEIAANEINRARAEGHRVVAVGTTTVRVLETAAAARRSAGLAGTAAEAPLVPFAGDTELFITPGYRFCAVDALVTNFHFPRSTLLMLVSAFAGRELTDAAYASALQGDYRFYSFGDAMLIL